MMLWSFLGSFWDPFFDNFLDHFWKPFWGPFSDQISQRGGKINPRGPSRASKTKKATFSKKWFSRWTVCIFSLLRPPKRASRGPRRLPRGTQRPPKPPTKEIQNWTQKLTNFDQFWGSKWVPKFGPKLVQKGTNKLNPNKLLLLVVNLSKSFFEPLESHF